jgi:CubicO group peptidase (beta-lactamase class C family)
MTTRPDLTALDAVLTRAALGHAVAGASVCLIDGRTEQRATTGVRRIGDPAVVSPDTVFPLGSVTKIVVATLVCRLAAAGRLDLDDPVGATVPELALLGDRGTTITARMLLSHSSGLVDAWDDSGSLAELLVATGLFAEPGTVFSYSNTGYVVLGRLIENLYATSWEEAARHEVLAPAGATSAVFTTPSAAAAGHVLNDHGVLVAGDLWPPVSSLFGAAGATMHATAADTARLVLACASGRTADGTQLLPVSMRDEMLRQQIALPGAPLHFHGWGLGWALPAPTATRGATARRVVEHIGGTNAFVHVEPDRGLALAVLTNFPEGWALGEDVLRGALGHRRDLPPIGPGPDDVHPYLGEYRSPAFGVTVRMALDGRLRITNPLTGGETDLHHQHGDSFWADFGDLVSEVSFLVDGGRARHVHTALRMLQRAD